MKASDIDDFISNLEKVISSHGKISSTELPSPEFVTSRSKELLGIVGDDELKDLHFKALHGIRTVLRAQMYVKAGGPALTTQEAFQTYLRVAEDQHKSEKMRNESLTCIGNGLYLNLVGFKHFIAKDVNGVERVMKLFQAPATALTLHRCTRILNISVQNYTALGGSGDKAVSEHTVYEFVKNLSAASIGLLSYVVRSKEPESFPGSSRNRVNLCIEILNLQLLLASRLKPEDISSMTGTAAVMFTELGVLLSEIMLLPLDLKYMFEMKCKVLTVLTFMPETYSDFLAANRVFPSILEVLERQIHATIVQGHTDYEIRLIPPLVVLSTAAKVSVFARQQIDGLVFLEKPAEEEKNTGNDKEEAGDEGEKKPSMEPEYAPPGTLIHFLIQMMANPQHQIAQLTGEFLFELCEQNSSYFIKRVGLGNAMGILQMKGLFNFGG